MLHTEFWETVDIVMRGRDAGVSWSSRDEARSALFDGASDGGFGIRISVVDGLSAST